MRFTTTLAILAALAVAGPAAGETVAMRGAYSSPKAFWETGARLDEYGINAIFVHGGSISPELLSKAREQGAKVYAEFATLNGKSYVKDHPEAWPINERGERAEPATWFMGVCPTEPGFRRYRMELLEKLLESRKLDGVWLDYLHWHAQFEDPNPVLPETCFSPTCLAGFQKVTGISVPNGTVAEKARWILGNHDAAWRDWRVSVVTSWAGEMRDILRRKQPEALLGIFHVPWTDEEFGGARRRILGVDFQELAQVADAFSPMVYHGRMGRPPEWVGEYVRWFGRNLGLRAGQRPLLWPIVQAHGDPEEIPPAEFERVLRGGVTGESSGVMMFTIRSVAQDPAKMEVLRKVYRSWE